MKRNVKRSQRPKISTGYSNSKYFQNVFQAEGYQSGKIVKLRCVAWMRVDESWRSRDIGYSCS